MSTKTWFLSTRKMSPRKEINVQFAEGNCDSFIANKICKEGDKVLIGHGGETSYKLGEVCLLNDEIIIDPKYALKPLLIFSQNPVKNDIKSAAKWEPFEKAGDIEGKDAYSLFGVGKDTVTEYYATDVIYMNIMQAITVLAFPEMSDEKEVKRAKSYLKKKKAIPSTLYKWKYNADFFYLTGMYDGWKEDILSLELWEKPELEALDLGFVDDEYLVFESFDGPESMKIIYEDEEYANALNELIYRSVYTVLIDIEAENLIAASLNAKPPIGNFIEKLIQYADEKGAEGCKQLFENY